MNTTSDLRIAHIATPKNWRGGEQQVVYLYEELEKRGVYQVLICRKNSSMEAYCKNHGFRYVALKIRFSMDPVCARRIAAICREHRVSYMHVHDSSGHTLSVISKDIFKNPAAIVLHRRVDFAVSDSMFSRYKYNHPGILKIICVSAAIREILKRDIRDHSRLEVIYDGVDTGRFSPGSKGILRKDYHIPDNLPLIANVAALSAQKDYFTFADTVGILVRKGVKACFLAIGAGPQEMEIKSYVREKGLENHILFTGFREDITTILPELDLLLFTSQTEGLGTSILDAFVCGIPVVATDAGGIPELVDHMKTGYLAPVKDPENLAAGVVFALENPSVVKEWVVAAKHKVYESFTREKMADAILLLYDKLGQRRTKLPD